MKGTRQYDFWIGENMAGSTRHSKRHKRDGLCHDCSRKAIEGHTYCEQHRIAQNLRKRIERRVKRLKQKGQTTNQIY
jgi:hypothetical protein